MSESQRRKHAIAASRIVSISSGKERVQSDGRSEIYQSPRRAAHISYADRMDESHVCLSTPNSPVGPPCLINVNDTYRIITEGLC